MSGGPGTELGAEDGGSAETVTVGIVEPEHEHEAGSDVDAEPVVRRRHSSAGSGEQWPRALSITYSLLAVVAAGVIIVSGVVAIVQDRPVTGDTGIMAISVHSVLTENPPLLGTWSSADPASGKVLHHPGPIELYVAAPFVEVLGSQGIFLATALVNAAAVVAIAVMARRWGRPAVAISILVATCLLVWTMGSGLQRDPVLPMAAMLPLLVGLVATWAVWQGSRWSLVWGTLGLSYAAQTHLTYAPFVALVILAMAIPAVVTTVRAFRGGRSDDGRRWLLALGVAVLAGVVSALPPLLEQASSGSDGNISQILSGSSFEDATGWAISASLILSKLTVQPWFVRGALPKPLFSPDLPTVSALVVGAVALTVAAAAAVWRGVVRRDRQVLGLIVLAVVLLAVGVVFGAQLPRRYGATPPTNFRWVWPLAVVLWAGILARPLELLMGSGARRRVTGTAVLGLSVALVLTALVPFESKAADRQPDWAERTEAVWRAVEPLADDLGSVELVASDQLGQFRLSSGLMTELADHGVDVTVHEANIIRTVGESFRPSGDEPWVMAFTGPDIETPPAPNARRIAVTQPLTPERAAEVEAELRELGEKLGPEGIVVADRTSAYERNLVAPALERYRREPGAALADGSMSAWLAFGLLDVVGPEADEVKRLAAERDRVQQESVAVWLVPREDWVD